MTAIFSLASSKFMYFSVLARCQTNVITCFIIQLIDALPKYGRKALDIDSSS